MQVPKTTLGLLVVLAFALLFLPSYTNGYYLQLSVVILTMVALAESWGFFSGYTGYISLGTAAFFGAGAGGWTGAERVGAVFVGMP